ncbi:MAG: CXXX repeat peptide maturase [Bacteroidales bacterium]|nr:CXXX repeat peptide maturase [Bacteroidales bacterium]
MLKYLIVQLDDTSTSFCHYTNNCKERRLIDTAVLEKAVLWAMKENLIIQYIYPDYELPAEYREIINRTSHADIVSATCADAELVNHADVVVCDSWDILKNYPFREGQAYVIRTTLADLLANSDTLKTVLPKLERLNVVITDVEGFSHESEYAEFLEKISDTVAKEYVSGHNVQLNLLTDRILLDGMNNCNAGNECITLAPDGKFYVCPAFYLDGKVGFSVGDVETGLEIKNPQLYRLDHAPICRNCDAHQCRRCVWMNRRLTLEVNTPGREQCVLAHLERNASRNLLSRIRESGTFLADKDIPVIEYLDPFEIVIKKK